MRRTKNVLTAPCAKPVASTAARVRRRAPGTPCVAGGTGTLLDLAYNFVDANGHNNGDVIGIANNRDGTRSQTFAYDALNRLATVGTVNTTSANWPGGRGYRSLRSRGARV